RHAARAPAAAGLPVGPGRSPHRRRVPVRAGHTRRADRRPSLRRGTRRADGLSASWRLDRRLDRPALHRTAGPASRRPTSPDPAVSPRRRKRLTRPVQRGRSPLFRKIAPVLVAVALPALAAATADTPNLPPVGHVFVIVLENKTFADTFGPTGK